MNNYIIKNSKWEEKDINVLFGDETVKIIDVDTMQDLCVLLGAYESKSKARQAGREGQIPKGFSEMWLNKRVKIWLWNPDKYINEYQD